MSDKRAIWKTLLYLAEDCSAILVEVKAGAKPLCVQLQQGIPAIWWLIDPQAEPVVMTIDIVGTGWIMPADWESRYIGTFQDKTGHPALVWHAFLRKQ